MTKQMDTRETYAEYLAGRASLEDLANVADRVLERYQADKDAARRSAPDEQSAPRTPREV